MYKVIDKETLQMTKEVLQKLKYNVPAAAKELNVSKATIYNRIKTIKKREKELSNPTKILWDNYFKDRSISNRNKLVEAYLGLTIHIITKIKNKLPDHVDFDNINSMATEALILCIGKFEPEREVSFGTYLQRRVVGAVYDSIREADHVPRLVRIKQKLLVRFCENFSHIHSRHPTREEIQDGLHLTDKDFSNNIIKHINSIDKIISCQHKISDFKDSSISESLIDRSETNNPFKSLDFLKEALQGLSMEEQMIIHLYYIYDNTMKTIGEVLGLSESRVSQIHSTIIERLKSRGKEYFLQRMVG